jgi:hypothetical protein
MPLDIEVGQSRMPRRSWRGPLLGIAALGVVACGAAIGATWNRTKAIDLTPPDALRVLDSGDSYERERAMAELAELAETIVERFHRVEHECVRESKYAGPWLDQIQKALDKRKGK